MSERGWGGGGGEGGQTTETPPACDQTVENTQTAHQENDTANRNPPQRDTATADSDAKFHDAEESLEDTEGTESACTGLENTQVTIAPTCHDAESAARYWRPSNLAKKRMCKADFTVFRQTVVGPRSGWEVVQWWAKGKRSSWHWQRPWQKKKQINKAHQSQQGLPQTQHSQLG